MSSLRSWNEFCDNLKKIAEDNIKCRPVRSPDDEALIIKNVARLMRQALDWEMECDDPHLPRPSNWEVTTLTGGPPGPNLDSPYALIRLDPKATYRMSGQTEGVLDVNCSIRLGFPPQDYRIFEDLGFADMELKDGRWEIYIAPQKVPGKPTLDFPADIKPTDVVHIFFRLYWVDWTYTRRPEYHIECLDPTPPVRTPRYTQEILDQQLKKTTDILALRSVFQHDWFTEFMKEGGGKLGNAKKPDNTPGGNSNVNYGGERFKIMPDEVLVAEFEEPKARYWSLYLYDSMVYDGADWFRNITVRKNLTSYVPPDRKVQIIFAEQDPGVKNWIGTGGKPEGIVFYRWIWAETRPPVDLRVVKISDLPRVLHPATPKFTPEQRAEELRIHREKMAHHFFW